MIHIVHESTRPGATIFAPGSPALAVHPDAAPRNGEPVFTKHLPGSFTGTPVEETLRIERLIRRRLHNADVCRYDGTPGRSSRVRGHRALGRQRGKERHRTRRLGSLAGFVADIKTTADLAASPSS